MVPPSVDVLIIGSGPIGSTYARLLHEHLPHANLLMVDAGPQVTEEFGRNVRNIDDPAEQSRVRSLSQGRSSTQAPVGRPGGGGMGPVEGTITARQGTHLVDPGGGMPAAAVATVLGGQGIHWTGSTPRPQDSERIPFINGDEWESALDRAESLLAVNDNVYPDSLPARAVQHALGRVFDRLLPPGRPVRPLPLAARLGTDGKPYWTGPETILGDAGAAKNVSIMSDTLCRRLKVTDGRVTSAILEHLPTGTIDEVTARAIVVCADGLRTPQLLWASGIRPEALGRYLTEHPLLFGCVALRPELVAVERPDGSVRDRLPWTSREPVGAMLGVGFADPAHPFHAQIMLVGSPPVPDAEHADAPAFVIVGWGCRKHPRAEDRVWFSDNEVDDFGMPRMRIEYALTDREDQEIAQARRHQARAAAALGPWVPGCEPSLAAPGTSLHFQGTFRMGPVDDGTSVCDSYGRVWAVDRLYLGGNGLIPTATACNPTLTSVALAVRGAQQLARTLGMTGQ